MLDVNRGDAAAMRVRIAQAIVVFVGACIFLFYLFARVTSEFRNGLDGDYQAVETPFALKPESSSEALLVGLHLASGKENFLVLPLFFKKSPQAPPRIVFQRIDEPKCRFTSEPVNGFEGKGRVRISFDASFRKCTWTRQPWKLMVADGTSVETSVWGYRTPVPKMKSGKRIAVVEEWNSTSTNHTLDLTHSQAFLRGEWVFSSLAPALTRYELLALQWWGNADAVGPWWIVGVVILVILAAFFIDCTHASKRLKLPIVVACSSLLLLWVYVAPPLHAPDEPDHLLSFFQSFDGVEKSQLPEELAQQAKRVHFERIKFYENQVYNNAYSAGPFPTAWAKHVLAYPVNLRSPLWTEAFRALRTFPGAGPFEWLMRFRLFNFAVLLLAFVLVSKRGVSPFVPFLLASPVLFFGAQMSNYVFMIAGILVFLSAFLDTRKATTVGLVAGLGMAACALSGRIGMLALFCVPALGVARAFVGEMDASSRAFLNPARKSACYFWSAFLVPMLIVVLLFPADDFGYIGSLSRLEKSGALQNPIFGKYLLFTMFAAFALSGVGAEFFFQWIRSHWGRVRSRFSERVRFRKQEFTWTSILILSGLVILTIASTAIRLVPLGDIELARGTDPLAYIMRVVPRFILNFGFCDPDPLLSQSFWSGFGWLDVSLPRRFLRVVKFLPFVSTLCFAILVARQPPRAAATAFLVSGLLSSVVLVTVQAFFAAHEGLNVHGRYLILPYVIVLSSTLVPLCDVLLSRARFARIPGLLFASGVVLQFSNLSFVLSRYFH